MNYLQDSNGQTITIPEISLFKGIVNFLGFTVRGEYSTDFTVPNDSQNRKILGYRSLNQTGKITEVPFSLYINGNKVSDGRVFIRSVDQEFDLFFLGGNSNWINRINGSIKDLDLSSYDVSFNATSVNARSTATEGIIFPVIDWAYFYKKLSNTMLVKPIFGVGQNVFYDFYPCFYSHTLFEEIFSLYGIKIAGNLLDDWIYTHLIVTPETIVSSAYSSVITGPTGNTESMSVYRKGISDQNVEGFVKVIMDEGTTMFNNALDRLVMTSNYTAVITYSAEWKEFETDTDAYIYINGVQVHAVNQPSGYTIQGEVTVSGLAGDYIEMYMETRPTNTVHVKTAEVIVSFQNTESATVYSSNIVPNILQIDFVRYICQRFNCLVDFNDVKQEITFTKLDSLQISDAVDYSDNIERYTIVPQSGFAKNNYVRTSPAEELVNYYSNNLNFGDLNITSDGDEAGQDIIITPLAPAETSQNTRIDWIITNIPLITLEDSGAPILVSSITNNGGRARFQVDDPALIPTDLTDYVFRILSADGVYDGFFVCSSHDLVSGYLDSYVPWVLSSGDSSLFFQRVSFNTPGPRELIVIPNSPVEDFNTGSAIYGSNNIKIVDDSGTYPYLNAAWAYFAKPSIGTDLDGYKVGLNYGEVTNVTTFTFGQLYFKNLTKIVQGQRLVAYLFLSQTEYYNLDLAKFIFLRTKDFEGYFLIEDIEAYTDQFTSVPVTLVRV